ncbi:hypothetical protein Zmor_014465 [Zophobas morio]|uniref:HTH CENPB-type domain-containing protein n=1 Tax=Zophobas morio TaxID=2755281 RepID=A0AA38IG07_9CUCU|nr:hypothetical protein Zmor_014465 [Zophobas morio]
MPGKGNKERIKVKWNQHSLNKAFKLVEEGKSIREAARSTGMPFSTLQEGIKNKNSNTPQLGRNTVFTKDQEEDMAAQVKFLANIFYGCTSLQIRKMAYEYAVQNNIKHNFSTTHEMAGKDWLKGFMRRNNLSVRKAKGTSLNKATAFNREEVTLFFDSSSLLSQDKEFNATPSRILQVHNFEPIPSTSGVKHVTAKDLLPISRNNPVKTNTRVSRKQHAIIITGTPNKEALVQKETKKMMRTNKNVAGAKTGMTKKRKSKVADIKKVKKRVFQDTVSSDTSDSDTDMTDLRPDDDTDIEEELENKCVICDDYERDNELWYRCVLCGLWAHAECSGYESAEGYMCDLCHART